MIAATSRAAIVVATTIALAAGARGEPAQTEAAAEPPAEPDDCGEPKRLDGIDVSSWQGEIDWRRVHKAGIVFAFARVSNGIDADERFAENFAGMRRAHVRRGAYQYFRASVDPKAQADLLVKAVRRAGGSELPVVADVETDDGQPREVLQAALRVWLARVEKRLRVRPIVYSSPSKGVLLDGKFGAWPLWVAHYDVECPIVPDGWERWRFWQKSQTGKVDGIAGNVDLDDFAGTRKALRRMKRRTTER